jgi:glycosyltransferase involved in cell wall biosynthesis
MPTITALLHTQNDGLRLGRCLEMLYACDDIVIIDHHSHDDTLRVAREYGARVLTSDAPLPIPIPLAIKTGWIFCVDPRESFSESLSTSLLECKSGSIPMNAGGTFSVLLREETAEGWRVHPAAQTRLVPANWKRWQGPFPVHDDSSQVLQGELLRFSFP